MNQKKRYGVVLVGCGTVAGYGHLPAIKRNRQARLVAVVDTVSEKAKSYASKFGAENWAIDYKEFLKRKDVDIVVITTPPSSHTQIAIDSFNAGKHVLCEKPITRNLEEAKQVLETVRRTGKKLVVGYILRHNKAYQKAKELIDKGYIGFPLVMRLMGGEHYEKKWQWERALRILKDTSPLIDCGCHYVDLMRWFTKSEAINISGIKQRLHPDVPEDNYDYGIITVQMKDGSVGTYEVGWGYNMPAFSIKQIIGPMGKIDILYNVTKEGKEEAWLEYYSYPKKIKRYPKVPIKQMGVQFQALLDCIENDTDPLPDLENAVKSLEIILAAHRAVMSEKVVHLK